MSAFGTPGTREYSVISAFGTPGTHEYSVIPAVATPGTREYSVISAVGTPGTREYSKSFQQLKLQVLASTQSFSDWYSRYSASTISAVGTSGTRDYSAIPAFSTQGTREYSAVISGFCTKIGTEPFRITGIRESLSTNDIEYHMTGTGTLTTFLSTGTPDFRTAVPLWGQFNSNFKQFVVKTGAWF